MFIKKLLLLYCLLVTYFTAVSQHTGISNNAIDKSIVFGNDKIKMILDYNGKANISSVTVNGQQVIEDNAGIYSSFKTQQANYSSLQLLSQPVVNINNNAITVSNIIYGDKTQPVNETWKFIITSGNIQFTIARTVSKPSTAEKVGLPVFMFKDTSVWDGAYTDYGGLAWFYLFNKKLDTYGVHTSASQFWNSKTGNGAYCFAVTSTWENMLQLT